MSKKRFQNVQLTNLGVGIAIGAVITMLVLLASTSSLEETATVIVRSLIGTLAVCIAFLIILYLFRDRILARLFHGAKGSVDNALAAASTLVQNLANNPAASSESAKTILKETSAWAGWYFGIRTLATTLLWLTGALIAALTTIVMITQTRVLQDQTVKIEAQTRLLERQNTIMAGEGQWELLWKAHYEITPEYQIDAVIRVETPDGKVTGADIRRGHSFSQFSSQQLTTPHPKDSPTIIKLFQEPPPDSLPGIDARALKKLRNSTITGWQADYEISGLAVESMNFSEAEVNLQHCNGCEFQFSSVKSRGDLLLANCNGRGSIFTARNITTGQCSLESAIFVPEQHLALNGNFRDIVVRCGKCCRLGVAAYSRVDRLVVILDPTDSREATDIIPPGIVSGRIDEIYFATEETSTQLLIDAKRTTQARDTVVRD